MVEQFLSTQEAADRLRVDKKTVLRYLHSGKLRGSKIGRDFRIPANAVTALLTNPQPDAAATPQREHVITAVVNQKGGVGKTTTTFNVGAALHRLGRRVLLVDLDPQGSLSVATGIPVAQLTATVYQTLLDENMDPLTLIQETHGGIHILPANIDLSAAEVELVNMTLRELVLQDVLEKLRPRYDHILIDCPPSLGLLTINALAAADQVIIPLQCEFLSTRGLNLLLRTLDKIKARLNRDLQVAGILPTIFDGRTAHANEVLQELRTNFPEQVYDIVIKDSVRVKESPAAGLSIFDYDPNHDVARSYMRLAQEVDHG